MGFVELDMLSPRGVTECVIEMEKPDGVKMKIWVKGHCPDIVGLGKAFWGEA